MESTLVNKFIELACAMNCANFDREHETTFAHARQLLSESPELNQTNLVTAAILGNVDRVQTFLAADPASATTNYAPREWPALLYLCFSRFLRSDDAQQIDSIVTCAQLLIDAGADPNCYFMLGDERETALYAACGVSNNAKLAKLLLNAGAEVNDGDASYHVAEFDNCDCIQVLFEHGMDENHRATVLLRKLDFEDADGVRAILRWGADPNAHGVWGKSSLHQAIMRRRSLEVIKALLDAGANPNDLRQDGASVYYLAARYGRPDVVELLHQFGLCPPELTPTEKLVAACGLADESTARQLTEQHSRLINTLNDDQRSAICDCGRSGSTRAIQVMLAVGFDITQQDNQGFTPLHWAAWYGHLECVNMLLERGAPVDITNNYNGEALDSAIWGYANSDGDDRNCRAIITSLVAAGADIERVTPFPSGHAESDAILRELGRSG